MRKLVVTLAFAAALAAQPQKSILGTVTEFKMRSLEIGLQPDDGAATYFKISLDTEVLQVQPGERDLSKANKVRLTDLSLSDRVLVSFVAGMPEVCHHATRNLRQEFQQSFGRLLARMRHPGPIRRH
jgi:hypothetical protein